MSQENVEIVRRIYGELDVSGFFDLLDEEVVVDPSGLPYPGLRDPIRGRDAAIRALRRYWGTWEDYVLEPVEIIDAGQDQVVAVLDERGRGRGSGVPFENRLAVNYTFSAGKIVSGSSSRPAKQPSKPPGCGSRWCRSLPDGPTIPDVFVSNAFR